MYITFRSEKSRLAKGERTYSQEGEDRILVRLFYESQHPGFYVDVGAHHPMRFSNTYLFYRQGWRGVNIDATPGSMRAFQRYRPDDVNIEVGIGTRGTIPFYMSDEPAVNSFNKELPESRGFKIARVVDVPVVPLSEALSGHLPSKEVRSFMTVDVEGHELEVLQSNDWSVFRPTYVLAELLDADVADAARGPVSDLLASAGYRFLAKTVSTVFYERNE